MKKLFLLSTMIFLLTASIAFAHQPRITMDVKNSENNPIKILEPEISKAYYGELKGQSDYYRIVSDKSFSLYVNILVPNIPVYNETRFSVEVKDITRKQIIFLNEANSTWEEFFEPFGQDSYIQGPEARLNVSQGIYYIKVFNSNNVGKYSLAVGEIESFPLNEILSSIVIIPILKINFFNKSIYTIFLNIAGLSLLVIIVIIIVLALVIRKIVKRFRKRKRERR